MANDTIQNNPKIRNMNARTVNQTGPVTIQRFRANTSTGTTAESEILEEIKASLDKNEKTIKNSIDKMENTIMNSFNKISNAMKTQNNNMNNNMNKKMIMEMAKVFAREFNKELISMGVGSKSFSKPTSGKNSESMKKDNIETKILKELREIYKAIEALPAAISRGGGGEGSTGGGGSSDDIPGSLQATRKTNRILGMTNLKTPFIKWFEENRKEKMKHQDFINIQTEYNNKMKEIIDEELNTLGETVKRTTLNFIHYDKSLKKLMSGIVTQLTTNFERLNIKLFSLGETLADMRNTTGYITDRFKTFQEVMKSGIAGAEIFAEDFTQFGNFLTGFSFGEGQDHLLETYDMLRKGIQSGLVTPFIYAGKTLDEVSTNMRRFRESISEGGFDYLSRMGFREMNEAAMLLLDNERRANIQATLQDIQTQRNVSNQLKFLDLIAQNTGFTVKELIEQTKDSRKQLSEFEASGILSQSQNQGFQKTVTLLKSRNQNDIADMLIQMAGAGSFERFLATNQDMLTGLAATGKTDNVRELYNLSSIAGNMDDKFLADNLNRILTLIREEHGLSGVVAAANIPDLVRKIIADANFTTSTKKTRKEGDTDDWFTSDNLNKLMHKMDDLMKNFARLDFLKFMSSIALNTYATIANTVALIGGGGGLFGLFGKGVKKLFGKGKGPSGKGPLGKGPLGKIIGALGAAGAAGGGILGGLKNLKGFTIGSSRIGVKMAQGFSGWLKSVPFGNTIKSVFKLGMKGALAGLGLLGSLGMSKTGDADTPNKQKNNNKSVWNRAVDSVKNIGKVSGSAIASGLGFVGKKIPGISLLIGSTLGLMRLMQGEANAAMLEVLSGLSGTFPGLGTVGSVAIDGLLAAHDFGTINLEKMSLSKLINEIFNKETSTNKETIKQYGPRVETNNGSFNDISSEAMLLKQILDEQRKSNEIAFGIKENTKSSSPGYSIDNVSPFGTSYP